MKLKPIGNDVIIHPIDHAPMSKGGLIFTAEAQRKRRINQGIIIAKGPLVTTELDIADHVVFSGYSGDKVVFASGGEYIVMPDDFVIAKIVNSEVVLVDTKTVERILLERKTEMKHKYPESSELLDEIISSVVDRIKSVSLSEGFEF
jgi:co-chaperonin GroES (HSP10)